jgi:hypothetical protein
MDAFFSAVRQTYHRKLLSSILTINSSGVPSNADKSSAMSKRIAAGILKRLDASIVADKLAGQTSGRKYESINAEFIDETFSKMNHIRPGNWVIRRIASRNISGISEFEQYSHLSEIKRLSTENSTLATVLGAEYMITPDIIIARLPLKDTEINAYDRLVDGKSCSMTAIRKENNTKPILHASISSKWTIRSDRSQNSRTEALNLIRNRKGRLPHIAIITAEPMPSRIASIAMGTGDIDCVYHSMLYELMDTVNSLDADDSHEMLMVMVEGKRLKDISDLPLDLTI